MNRRNLFKLLAGATLAAAIEVTGLVPALKKVVKSAIVNPQYVDAPYERLILFSPAKQDFWAVVVKREEGFDPDTDWKKLAPPLGDQNTALVPDLRRPRYNFENGQWVQVPYYATIEEEVPV